MLNHAMSANKKNFFYAIYIYFHIFASIINSESANINLINNFKSIYYGYRKYRKQYYEKAGNLYKRTNITFCLDMFNSFIAIFWTCWKL